MDLKALGKRIQARRLYKKLKQVDVADKIGTSRSNYARYEAGDVDINITTLEAIAKALGVPLSYLVPDDDEWAPEGESAEFFVGVAPEDQGVAQAVLESLREKARRAESVIGRKAE